MKSTLFIASMMLGGAVAVSCSPAQANERGFWDTVICYGAGTCGATQLPPANGYTYSNPNSLNPTLPTTVLTGQGTVLIVPNYSGGALPRAIIPVSKQ